jgi:hypothetical protein
MKGNCWIKATQQGRKGHCLVFKKPQGKPWRVTPNRKVIHETQKNYEEEVR